MAATDLTCYLHDTKASARVLYLPKSHSWSVATGFIIDSNGSSIFVKDRNEQEAKVQAVCHLLGQAMGRFFENLTCVPTVQVIERPALDSLKEGTAGHALWKLKEEKWKDQYGGKWRCCHYEKRRPSSYDCWQLETAVQYYDKRNVISDNNDIDTSLRRKLRQAANRSQTNCLDVMSLLLLTQCTQSQLHSDEWGKDYVKYGKLDNFESGLTPAETKLLLEEKLAGYEVQVALLFTAVVGLMDCNLENVAVCEVVTNGSGEWRLGLVHFDTGLPPAHASVDLTNLEVLHEDDDSVDYDFDGDPKCTGYYMPFLMLFPVCNMPLCEKALQGLKSVDGGQFQAIVEEEFQNFEYPLTETGAYMKTRIERMQDFVSKEPEAPLRNVLFQAIQAWKRDWAKYCNESFTNEWFSDMFEWCEVKKN